MSRLEGGYEHLATKADVESVRVDLERLRADMTAEIGSVRTEIRDSKVSTIFWLTGIMAVVATAQIGAVVALLRVWPG